MPYFVIFVFLIRATTLEGAIDGIRFYLEPDWSKLKSINVRGELGIYCQKNVRLIIFIHTTYYTRFGLTPPRKSSSPWAPVLAR